MEFPGIKFAEALAALKKKGQDGATEMNDQLEQVRYSVIIRSQFRADTQPLFLHRYAVHIRSEIRCRSRRPSSASRRRRLRCSAASKRPARCVLEFEFPAVSKFEFKLWFDVQALDIESKARAESERIAKNNEVSLNPTAF